MEDPLPENIDGEKRVVHTVNHNVNWGYVALAVLGILVIVKLAPVVASSQSDNEDAEPVIE